MVVADVAVAAAATTTPPLVVGVVGPLVVVLVLMLVLMLMLMLILVLVLVPDATSVAGNSDDVAVGTDPGTVTIAGNGAGIYIAGKGRVIKTFVILLTKIG